MAAVTADCSCQVTQTDHTSHSRAQRSSADNPLLTDGITRCLPCRPDFLRGPDQQPQPPSLWPGLCRRPRQPHAARELSHCSGSSRLPSGASWEVPSQRAFHANAEALPSLPGVGWWVTADPQLRAHSYHGKTSTTGSRASQPVCRPHSVNPLGETLGLGFPICNVGITALPASQAGGGRCESKHTGASEGPAEHSSRSQECSCVPVQPQRAVHTPLRPARLQRLHQ